jgi:H+/gluconate symporter-like permease
VAAVAREVAREAVVAGVTEIAEGSATVGAGEATVAMGEALEARASS